MAFRPRAERCRSVVSLDAVLNGAVHTPPPGEDCTAGQGERIETVDFLDVRCERIRAMALDHKQESQ